MSEAAREGVGVASSAWRPRLSVRGLMVSVAILAVAFGAYTTRQYGARRSYCLDRARAYGDRSREFALKADEAKRRAAVFLRAADDNDGDRGDRNRKWADDELLRATLLKRVADFDARQEQRFLLAADRPWDALPADVQEPSPVTR